MHGFPPLKLRSGPVVTRIPGVLWLSLLPPHCAGMASHVKTKMGAVASTSARHFVRPKNSYSNRKARRLTTMCRNVKQIPWCPGTSCYSATLRCTQLYRVRCLNAIFTNYKSARNHPARSCTQAPYPTSCIPQLPARPMATPNEHQLYGENRAGGWVQSKQKEACSTQAALTRATSFSYSQEQQASATASMGKG